MGDGGEEVAQGIGGDADDGAVVEDAEGSQIGGVGTARVGERPSSLSRISVSLLVEIAAGTLVIWGATGTSS